MAKKKGGKKGGGKKGSKKGDGLNQRESFLIARTSKMKTLMQCFSALCFRYPRKGVAKR